MPSKTITVTNGDGSTRTITIPDRSRFAGKRTIERGYVYPASQFSTSGNTTYWSATSPAGTDGTEWDLVSDLGNDNTNNFASLILASNYTASKVRVGKHRVEFDLILNSGVIDNGASNISDRPLLLVTRDYDADPEGSELARYYEVVEGFNSIDVEVFDDGVEIAGINFAPNMFFSARPSSVFDVTVSNLKVTHNYEEITVDRTAQVVTSDRKGESRPLLTKVVGGASAAYSLRDLNDKAGNNKVVRVRRESDNNERDFTAKEVSNGTLQNWTNAQVTPPLDLRELTATGRDGPIIEAAAAYSLRNLSDSYTGYVVDVRRSSDGNTEPFTATEVADGTLEAWVGLENKIVQSENFSSNSWNKSNNRVSITSDLITAPDGEVTADLATWSTPNFADALSQNKTITAGTYTASIYLKYNGSQWVQLFFGSTGFSGGHANFDLLNGVKGNSLGSSVIEDVGDGWYRCSLTRTSSSNGNTGTCMTIPVSSGSAGRFGYGIVGSYYVWGAQLNKSSTAQTYARTASGISGDGTVSKWYDQSTTSGVPNAKHAVQTSPASQPKIVDGGTLATDANGKPEMVFDGSNHWLDLGVNQLGNTEFFADSSDSWFTTAVATYSSGTLISKATSTYTSREFQIFYNLGQNSVNARAGTTTFGADTDRRIFSFNWDGSNAVAGVNGVSTTVNVGSAVKTNQNINIGSRTNGGFLLNGSIQEIIVYDSDQTDNRTALEANIGEVYGIAGIPAYEDTVNGFVETWYDQSGNGNNATQLTASKQPKIVDGGVLVTRNGDAAIKSTSDNVMDFTLDSLSADGQQSVFSVLENDVTSQDQFSEVFKVYSTTPSVRQRRPHWFGAPSGDLVFSVDANGGFTTDNRNYRLYSHIMNNDAGGTSALHRDGTQVDTRSITLDTNPAFFIGKLLGVSQNATGAFYMSELIYYPSDQSANRPAIEANINNQYDI